MISSKLINVPSGEIDLNNVSKISSPINLRSVQNLVINYTFLLKLLNFLSYTTSALSSTTFFILPINFVSSKSSQFNTTNSEVSRLIL